MRMLRKVNLILIFCLLPLHLLHAKDNKSRLSLGGGIYNFMKHGSDNFNQSSVAYNVELFSGKKAFNFVRPFIGFLGTDESAYYGYFGLSVDLYFANCKCFVITPSLVVPMRMAIKLEWHTIEFVWWNFMYNFEIMLE